MEGEIQMINEFKRDIGIKVVSVFFAILLWLFVLNNVDNPFEKKNLDVGITVLNQASLEEKNLGLNSQLPQTYVQVEVKGRKDRNLLISAADIEATVDFSTIKDAGEKELPIKVSSKIDGVDVTLIKPKTLSVHVEKVIQKTIPITVTQSGKMKENYKITKITPQPDNIVVEGVESLVNQATNAKTVLDVNNINKSITLKKDYKVYTDKGDEISELGKNGSVEVTVEVAKEVNVIPTIKGKPAKDYVITGYTTNKDRVLVTGFPEQLDQISDLSTEVVNVENISKNSDIISFIKVPDGIKLVDTQKDITVSVKVEQLKTKDFTVNKSAIVLQNTDNTNFTYAVVPDSYKFTLKGLDKDLNSLDISNIKVTVDLTGATEGTVSLPVNIILPNNDINRSDNNNIDIKIIKNK